MPDVEVVLGQGGTDQTNPYICGIFDLAQLLPASRNVSEKQHVVKFAPKLAASSGQYVHHMILFGCDAAASYGVSLSHNQVIGECESMPPGCYALKWPWAVGSEDVVFPADVGMPFGGDVHWVALQMHYYNPSLDAGIKDSSGVQLIFSDSLRTHDAAVFDLNGGTHPTHRDPLPAGQADITLSTTVVPKECTNTWSVPSINVLGVVYHGHLIGKSFNIDVTNSVDGSYRGTLRREKRYDFNHQSLEPTHLNTISRGDELTFTCKYDTSSRTEPTEFGTNTQHEMCWSAFTYYPAQAMTGAMIAGAESISCEGMPKMTYSAPVVAPPACTQVGDLNSSDASTILSSVRAVHSETTDDVTTSSSPPSLTWLRSVICAFVMQCLLRKCTV
jgi:hypothetical protein